VVRKLGTSAFSPGGKTLYVCIQRGRLDVLSCYAVATRATGRKVAAWAPRLRCPVLRRPVLVIGTEEV